MPDTTNYMKSRQTHYTRFLEDPSSDPDLMTMGPTKSVSFQTKKIIVQIDPGVYGYLIKRGT